MKIHDTKLTEALQSRKTEQSRRSGKGKEGDESSGASAPTSSGGADKVQVSSARQHIQSLKARLDQLPDVRVEKVERIQAQIDSGTYQVPDAADVAEKMIAEALFLDGKFGVS